MSEGDQGAHRLPGQVEYSKHQAPVLPFFSYRAYKDYKAAVEAGEDGEPHFHARKACDYLKSAVEVFLACLF